MVTTVKCPATNASSTSSGRRQLRLKKHSIAKMLIEPPLSVAPPMPMAPRSRNKNKAVTCPRCKQGDVYWTTCRVIKRKILVDVNNVRHECDIDIRPGACIYCKRTDELFWIKRDKKKVELVESYGLQHICPEFTKFLQDWKEALRINYAWEKKWVNSFPKDTKCPDCKHGVTFVQKRKWTYMFRCTTCRGLGSFSGSNIHSYLKALRKKYWPYKPHFKWKVTSP